MRRLIKPIFAVIPAVFWITISAMILPETTYAKKPSWDFHFNLGAAYDNNILNYSDADLDQFDTTATDSAGKFGIESKDDFIFSPRADIGLKAKFLNHTFQAGCGAGYYIYAKNDAKNYASANIWMRQFLRKATYLELAGSYLPDYYYRNLYATGAGFRKARFSKLGFEVKLAFPIHKSLRGSLIYNYYNKDFNTYFDERDLKAHTFGFDLSFRPVRLYRIWGGYEYAIARSAGRDNPNDRRDTSYDMFLIRLGSQLYLTGLENRELRVGASITFKDILFQTDKLTAEDRYRFGRQDNRWSITLNAAQDITKKLAVGFVLNRLINKANLDAKELKPYLDFSSTSAKIVFDYSF
jgi:hypothetical protein